MNPTWKRGGEGGGDSIWPVKKVSAGGYDAEGIYIQFGSGDLIMSKFLFMEVGNVRDGIYDLPTPENDSTFFQRQRFWDSILGPLSGIVQSSSPVR